MTFDQVLIGGMTDQTMSILGTYNCQFVGCVFRSAACPDMERRVEQGYHFKLQPQQVGNLNQTREIVSARPISNCCLPISTVKK